MPRCKQLRANLINQANLLGIQSTTEDPEPAPGADFVLHHQALSPIACEFTSPASWLSPAYQTELILQAASGVMSVHGRAIGKAQPLGINYLSVLCSAMALMGALACAIGQRRGGAFQRVGVSPLGCGHLSIAQYLAGATARQNPERFVAGHGDSHSVPRCPPLLSADGIVFELETLSAEPWRRFWEGLGVESDIAARAWKSFLLRYATASCTLPEACVGAVQRLSFEEISTRANLAGIAVVPVRRVQDRQSDPDYPQSSNNPWRLLKATHQSSRATTAVNPPVHLPLQGIKVVESCRRIQGPLAGHLLALLGADVIRLEPPGGDPLRTMEPCVDGCSVRFNALNRLKSVVEIDIRSASGRARIDALARESDVFLHNWAPGKAEQLQLTPARLHLANPGLVYAWAGGWHQAPVRAPATDFTTQAWSGVASAIATQSDTRGGSLFTVLDVLGGVVCALATTAAILRQTIQKTGLSIETSLLGTADLLMTSGLLKRSSHTTWGVFAAQSGLIAIDCQEPDQARLLARLLDLPDGAQDRSRALIEKRLSKHPASTWESELTRHGISACTVAEDLAAMANDQRFSRCFSAGAYCTASSPWSFQ